MTPTIIELGNLHPPHGKWKSQQYGRVYSVEGLSPCLGTMQGGGREPKVLVEWK